MPQNDIELKEHYSCILDEAITKVKSHNSWYYLSKSQLAQRIVSEFDAIATAQDFPAQLPVRNVISYSLTAFKVYIRLGCYWIAAKTGERYNPATIYMAGRRYCAATLNDDSYINIRTLETIFGDPLFHSLFVIGCYNFIHESAQPVPQPKIEPPLTLQSATTLAAPPIAPTVPLTKTNTVSSSATKTSAAYKPVPNDPAKP